MIIITINTILLSITIIIHSNIEKYNYNNIIIYNIIHNNNININNIIYYINIEHLNIHINDHNNSKVDNCNNFNINDINNKFIYIRLSIILLHAFSETFLSSKCDGSCEIISFHVHVPDFYNQCIIFNSTHYIIMSD